MLTILTSKGLFEPLCALCACSERERIIQACKMCIYRKPPETFKPPYTRQDLIWAPRTQGSSVDPSDIKFSEAEGFVYTFLSNSLRLKFCLYIFALRNRTIASCSLPSNLESSPLLEQTSTRLMQPAKKISPQL